MVTQSLVRGGWPFWPFSSHQSTEGVSVHDTDMDMQTVVSVINYA